MNDLAIGNIYKITCNLDPSIYYIGSTFSSIARRFKGHKYDYNAPSRKPMSIYKCFDKYGVDNFSVSLIKSYKVVRTHNKDTKHLHAYEQLWINKLNKCCNKKQAFDPIFKITKREADRINYLENRASIVERKSQWYMNNKERMKAKNANYRANNRERIRIYQASYRAKQKLENN